VDGQGSLYIAELSSLQQGYGARVRKVDAGSQQGATIDFAPLPNKTYGDPDFTVSATASTGLAVSFTASGNCTITGSLVHITGAGNCTIIASQPGDVNNPPALSVSRTFAIAKASQTITFAALSNRRLGAADFTVSASASSGLAVVFTALGRCTVTGARVHLTGAGSCTITALQPGNANYNAAAAVSRSFTITRKTVVKRCKVPNLVGKTLARARALIKLRHCRTGRVSKAYSRKRKKNVVIGQSRRPGRVLPAGSRINLVVSRGRRR
jgi:PASTA domain-containing protein